MHLVLFTTFCPQYYGLPPWRTDVKGGGGESPQAALPKGGEIWADEKREREKGKL